MLITTDGIIIQIKCDDISNLGRITSGVKLINLDDGVKVATIAKVRKKPVDENDKDADGFEEESQEKSAVVSEADSQPEGEKEPESEIDASIDELLERAEKIRTNKFKLKRSGEIAASFVINFLNVYRRCFNCHI